MAARTKRPKQGHLEGMAPPRIKAVDEAAEIYFETMQDRCKLSKEEDEAKDNLIDKMKEHGMDRYEISDGLVVTVTSKSNVKVKRKADLEVNGEAEE